VGIRRLLAAAGTPPGARGDWPVLVAGRGGEETLLWVIGIRRAAVAPLTGMTAQALRVRVLPAGSQPSEAEIPTRRAAWGLEFSHPRP
jgi:hypothetical protein